MTEPLPAARPLDPVTVAAIGAVGIILVAGFVVLSALGRDVTAYSIFLGGPAVTAVVGGILRRSVTQVAAVVDATQQQTKEAVAVQVSGLDAHLQLQDQTLGEIHAGINGEPPATPTPAAAVAAENSVLPVPRSGPVTDPVLGLAALAKRQRS